MAASIDSEPSQPVMRGTSALARLLNDWYQAGTAAGNTGDFYDNRDSNHSRIDLKRYPQVQEITYTEEQRRIKADYGIQRTIHPHVVIGNSSISASVWSVGSMPRVLYGTPRKGLTYLHTQYRSNNLYIFPEHRDHDPGNGGFPGHGDLYMANSPYLLISQGSSGSDRKFLHACFQTLAAFHPDIKQQLRRTGTLVPTLQAVLRKCTKQVVTASDYLTGAAHPTVFEGGSLNIGKMIEMAHAMERDTIPPLVALHVVEEDRFEHENTFLDTQRSEAHADTSASIARIFRRSADSMHIMVSAEHSQDILGRDLEYHWVVLRGDPQAITIKERLDGAMAEITVPYPARRPITPNSFLASNRIDIGVFVSVDGNYSAPAFVTFFGLDNERRIYDSFGRLYSIAYDAKHQLNFPLPTDIQRWHRLMRLFLFDRDDDTQRVRILFPNLPPRQIKYIAAQATELAALYDQYMSFQQQLNTASDKTEEGELRKSCKALASRYQDRMNKPIPNTQRALVDVLREALRETTLRPNFYLQHKATIDTFLSQAKANYKNRFANELKAMTARGYYSQTTPLFADVEYRLPIDFPHTPTFANSRYQDFHATVISTAFAPDFFPMPKRINCVDPRLTQPKPFRDVLHYDTRGALMGWTRYRDNGKEEFHNGQYTEPKTDPTLQRSSSQN